MNKKNWILAFSLIGALVVVSVSGIALPFHFGTPVQAESNQVNNGYGGYGMMGGSNSGMMGGNSGMMGSQFGGNNGVDFRNKQSADRDMNDSLTNATVDKSGNTITYTGNAVKIVMLGGPDYADGKFVIGGLVNPDLKIPQGTKVTLEMINEDEGMPHGVEITSAAPPYDYMSMMQGGVYPGSFIHPVQEASSDQYPTATISFVADQAGTYYYICQYPGHAEKGMYGKIIIE
ncbi:type-1 copper (blue) proteins signature [Lucifera butyrica]|uniref:Type-1 copper (Blue) proteins signature n=1 Tax=Lucifera butyrica TaxID=1351585 RepID=A0A498RBY8_9FIRM|nr:plastocyanin/azurin family copper-binding protein [Lucifera butyrica]VBB08901.1 type-1 copper (blue) proteins signature [Lucifera butyrica]